jgi:hypothetical protein
MPLSKEQIAAVSASRIDPAQLEALFGDGLDNQQWKEVLELRKRAILNRKSRGDNFQTWHLIDGVCWGQEVRVPRVEPKRGKRLSEFDSGACTTILFQDGKGWWQDPFLFYLVRLRLGIAMPASLPTGNVSVDVEFDALISRFRENQAQAMAYYEPPNNTAKGSKTSERSKWAEDLIIACSNVIDWLNRSAGALKGFSHIIREAESAGYSRAFLEATRDPKKEELNKKAAAFIRTNPLTDLVRAKLNEFLQENHRPPSLREFRKFIGCKVLSGKHRDKKIQIGKYKRQDSQFVNAFKNQMRVIRKNRKNLGQ